VKLDEQPIAILSDQTLLRQGVAALLRARGFRHVLEFADGRELLDGARKEPPAAIFIDLDHEREDTLTLVGRLRRELAGAHLIWIGSALRQGAANGDDDELETPGADAAALAAALLAHPPRSSELRREHARWAAVTPRQREVLRWMAIGADNRTIARKLRVSERAIKAHVSTLLRAFDFSNRTQLALLAERAGLRPPRAVQGQPGVES
jgi:DNA-binding NarL/FixJ family response regulator